MALNLNSLAGKTATLSVDFMGQSTKIVYDPSVLTAASLNDAQTGTDDGFLLFFAKMVKSWDVTKGNTKVPLTTKGLREVPLILLRAIFAAIMAEAGNGEAGKVSNDG